MTTRVRTTAWAAPVLAAGLLLSSAAAANAATTTALTASALAANEAPTPGPAGASAQATFTVDASSGQICYTVTSTGLADAVAAHIHRGATGTNGPVVVPLDVAGFNKGTRACASATPALATEIAADPAGFYFNVHTPAYSNGAARGQLGLGPSGVPAGSGGLAGTSDTPGLLLLTLLAGGGALTVVSARRLLRR